MTALPSIKDFRPSESTTTAIRAAFQKLIAAREDNSAEMDRMQAARPSLLMTGAPAEIRRTDETLRDRAAFAEQLDMMETELRSAFTSALEADEDRAYADSLASVRAQEAAWNLDMQARYPVLVAGLIELLTRERELLRAFRETAAMPGASRARVDLGATLRHPSRAMVRGYYSPNSPADTIGALVTLPSLEPGSAHWGRR